MYRWVDPILRPEGLRCICSRQLIMNRRRLSPQAVSTFSAVLLSFFEQMTIFWRRKATLSNYRQLCNNWGSVCSLAHDASLAPSPACYKHIPCPATYSHTSCSYQGKLEQSLHLENSPFMLYFLYSALLIFPQLPFETAQVLTDWHLSYKHIFLMRLQISKDKKASLLSRAIS